MKNRNIKYITLAFTMLLVAFNCSKNEALTEEDANLELAERNGNTLDLRATYILEDQMGRPAINTVFVNSDSKDAFNMTIPSEQGALYQPMFQTNLMALSPAFANPGDTNALGLDAATFTSVLATDVLNVSLTGTTTFFDGTNVLTGRALADDVITVELILIFGGETGLTAPEFPGLSDDNVNANDKEFLDDFPYLASAW